MSRRQIELHVGDTWWHAQATPLGGRQAVAAYWDVTERTQRASEQLNREIVAGLQEGVVVVDTDARVVRRQRGGRGAVRRARSTSLRTGR